MIALGRNISHFDACAFRQLRNFICGWFAHVYWDDRAAVSEIEFDLIPVPYDTGIFFAYLIAAYLHFLLSILSAVLIVKIICLYNRILEIPFKISFKKLVSFTGK